MRRLTASETARRLAALGFEDAPATAFAFRDEARGLRYGWHAHTRHQLLYSFRGAIHLETATAAYLLPPQRAAWIPAALEHRTRIDNCDAGSVYFTAGWRGLPADRLRIVAAPPLLREMMDHAMRWPATRDPLDRRANRFFTVLADLCAEWLSAEMPFWLPRSDEEPVERAVAYADAHLRTAGAAGAARAARLSERTFRRVFGRAMGMSWRDYLRQARLLAALPLLGDPHRSVTAIAAEVGFDSASAFAREFARLTGETPRDYRRRLLAAP